MEATTGAHPALGRGSGVTCAHPFAAYPCDCPLLPGGLQKHAHTCATAAVVSLCPHRHRCRCGCSLPLQVLEHTALYGVPHDGAGKFVGNPVSWGLS